MCVIAEMLRFTLAVEILHFERDRFDLTIDVLERHTYVVWILRLSFSIEVLGT